MKGQISTFIAIIGASGTVLASLIGGWYLSADKVNQIDKLVNVVQERENNHYLELKEKLEAIDKKLDLILKR